ncbi:hypothetical protein NliqN6_2777 [Naganishia liquefaciens]|uniref:ATPase BadF/BadG/BcrA/BcrD type domain-containing protein n=1 Tax=Naganishia liquefaciens TaxID=104408 RepID=A0A8H3TSF5_9TREE|nr:hypothetical protein NliqN6_2777 [Naganishia liquefaciens]
MPLFLCVDVGGSKTAASIADAQGGIIGRGYAGSGNLAEVGPDRCFARIRHAVEAAIAATSVSPTEQPREDVCSLPFQDIWIGIAGCDTAVDEASITPRLSAYFQRSVTPTNDALLLASDALLSDTRYSIALVAGTGSVILGLEIPPSSADEVNIDTTGRPIVRCRKGGNGHLLGDHGSAYHLGVTAARIAADDHSMRRPTDSPLYASLCSHYGVANPGDLPARIHQLDSKLDVITAANTRKLLIATSSALILHSIAQPQADPLGFRIIQSCIEILAADIHDVTLALSQQTRHDIDGGFQLAQATLAMTGGIAARPSFREMLVRALSEKGVVFAGTTFVEHAGDHGAIGLSRAWARAAGKGD